MKKTNMQQWLTAICFSTVLAFTSCKGGAKDEDVQKSFAEKARTDGRLSNISATVNDGVLTLNGSCPDETCRSYAEQTAKELKGVKSVVNNITTTPPVTTAPVEVSGDAALQTGVRDALKDYPGVTGTVTNGEVVLTGTIQRDRLTNLMQSLNSLNARKITNNLTIQ